MANISAHNFFATGENPKPLGTEHPNIVPYQAFQASDGLFIVAIGNDKMWSAFTDKIGIETLKDPMYATNKGRVIHREQLIPILEEIFSHHTRQEWDDFFSEINIPVGPVDQLSEILSDSHVIERGMVQENYA